MMVVEFQDDRGGNGFRTGRCSCTGWMLVLNGLKDKWDVCICT